MPWTPLVFSYSPFADGLCAPGYLPPGPPNVAAPQVNIALPQLSPVYSPAGTAEMDLQHSEVPTPDDSEAAANENTGARFYQSPIAPPVVLDEYPSLIVLKSGGVYAVTKYWTRQKTLYFLTPTGQTFQTPLNRLEQIYPRTKRDRGSK